MGSQGGEDCEGALRRLAAELAAKEAEHTRLQRQLAHLRRWSLSLEQQVCEQV